MPWLGPSDDALRDLAARLAEEIETAVGRAEELEEMFRQFGSEGPGMYKRLQKLEAFCDVTRVVATLGPQLQAVLRDLGGSPGSRKALREDKPIGGRLADLRAAAVGQHDS